MFQPRQLSYEMYVKINKCLSTVSIMELNDNMHITGNSSWHILESIIKEVFSHLV